MKHWIEACVVILVITILLGISIPRFLKGQSGEVEKRIHDDVVVLFEAIKKYKVDFPQIIGATNFGSLPAVAGIIYDTRITNGGSYGQHVHVDRMKNVYLLSQFLVEKGYVDPNFQFQYFTDSNPNTALMYVSAQERNTPAMTEHCGFAALWHRTAPEKFVHTVDKSTRLMNRNGYTVTPPNHTYTTLLKPDYYFSITNGMTSLGYVYVDSLGNSSSSK